MSGYTEDEYLQLSGLQHFSFCSRQWALIHLEQQWSENLRTVEGDILHERVHAANTESRGNIITMRGLRVANAELGIAGSCDAVEFHKCKSGVPLKGRDGLWQPYPVEYKRGTSKANDADRLQLCAQAMCLEKMLCCDVSDGAIYYHETKRREKVELTTELREKVQTMLEQMHEYAHRGYTPKVKTGAFCRACSLKELCMPKLCQSRSASSYMMRRLYEGDE